jgi:diguanylate cyclase (GGDEF)-like protein
MRPVPQGFLPPQRALHAPARLKEHDALSMETDDRRFGSAQSPGVQDDLRERVSTVLLDRATVITADTVAVFPYTIGGTIDAEQCARLGAALLRLLGAAIRDGHVNSRGELIAAVRALVFERSIDMSQLFTCAYLVERTALDELALDASIGATTEPWPLVAQLVRRGSFEYLGTFAGREPFGSAGSVVTDTLTTVYTRPVFDAVLIKETERSGRLGYALALILFDLDGLSAINDAHGYGVGSQILERLGILMRRYFRQHDWVARHGDDQIAVLLTGSDAEHAGELAERARVMIEQRLGFADHRTDAIVPVTVTAAVVNVAGASGSVIDPERLLIDAEAALARAKQAGRNRVERTSSLPTIRTLPRNWPSA